MHAVCSFSVSPLTVRSLRFPRKKKEVDTKMRTILFLAIIQVSHLGRDEMVMMKRFCGRGMNAPNSALLIKTMVEMADRIPTVPHIPPVQALPW